MNPFDCRIVLRPRTPAESVDLALRMMQTHAGLLLRLALWVLGPFVLAALASPLLPLGPTVVLSVVVVLSPVLQAPFTALGARLLFDDAVALPVLKTDARAMASTVVARWTVWGLIGLASAVTCGLALVPAWLASGFAGEVVLLERQPLGMALRRATSLVSREGGAAVGAALALGTLTLWGAMAGELLGQLVVGFVLQLGTPWGAVWEGTMTPFLSLGLLGAQPLIAWARLLLYLDVRTRTEGWDLQVRARAVVNG